jgi:hypothetical protein
LRSGGPKKAGLHARIAGHDDRHRLARPGAARGGHFGPVGEPVLSSRLKELRQAGLVTLTEGGYLLTPQGSERVRHFKPLVGWAHAWDPARISPADQWAPP